MKSKTTKRCKACGRPFFVTSSGKLYCESCAIERAKKQRKLYDAKRSVKRYPVTCDACGAECEVGETARRCSKFHYCPRCIAIAQKGGALSPEKKLQYVKERLAEKGEEKPKQQRLPEIAAEEPKLEACVICKKEISADEARTMNDFAFCPDCYNLYLSEVIQYDNPLDRLIQARRKYEAHQADKFICNCCNSEISGKPKFIDENYRYCKNCYEIYLKHSGQSKYASWRLLNTKTARFVLNQKDDLPKLSFEQWQAVVEIAGVMAKEVK